MNILSVESSCDETAVAIVRDGREVLTDCIASQVDLHRLYGGVIFIQITPKTSMTFFLC